MKLLKPIRQTSSNNEGSGPVLPQFMAFLDRCSGLISRLGIDYAQYRLIVATKLKIANREHVGLGMNVNQKREQGAHPLRTVFLLYLLVGALLCMFLISPVPKFYLFSSYFALLFVMAFLNMLTSYSSLMLDPRDHAIYTVRGVPNKTLNAARLTVVALYMGVMMAGIGGPGVIPVVARFGVLAAIGQVIAVLLLTVFSFMLALFIYLLVLRFFDGERLKNILNMVQIVMMIGIYVGSQILPHISANFAGNTNAPQAFIWYFIFAMPMWFAGIPMLVMGEFSLLSIVMTVMALVGTGALTYIYFRQAGNFEQYLEKLNNSTGTRHKPSAYFHLTQRLFTRDNIERTYFNFGWSILREEREFKLRVYPQMAYGLIIPLVVMFSFVTSGLGAAMPMIRHFGPYMVLSMFIGMPVALWSLGFSSQPAAMRLFQRVPLQQHGLLLRGIVKAMFARVCLPVVIFMAVIAAALDGLNGLFVAVTMAVMLYALTLFFGRLISGVDLPFSQEFDPNRKGGTAAITWITMLAMPVIAAVVIVGGLFHIIWLPVILLIIAAVAIVLIGGSYKNGVRFDVRRI